MAIPSLSSSALLCGTSRLKVFNWKINKVNVYGLLFQFNKFCVLGYLPSLSKIGSISGGNGVEAVVKCELVFPLLARFLSLKVL